MEENSIEVFRNNKIKGSSDKFILVDVFIPANKGKSPVMVFCHGFKGFKDWGYFNAMAMWFASKGVAVCKFNFSHSGVNPEKPEDISDFELFGQNNYSKEVEDIGHVLTWLKEQAFSTKLDFKNLTVAGHSRGGSIAFIRAASDDRIKKVILWAAPFDLKNYFRPDTIAMWEMEGKVEVENKRTGDIYPLYKQFYDDYIKNKLNLNIPKISEKFNKPLLILHGSGDSRVPVSEAHHYFENVPQSIFIEIEGAEHTFGGKHPYEQEEGLTNQLLEVFENSIEFIIDE